MSSAASVLIVDDEIHLRDTLSDILADFGFAVEAAADGQAAVDMCTDHEYYAVLLDICMPILGGLEALKQIRARSGSGRVFLMSAHASEEEVQLGLAAGAEAFLPKPLDLDKVLGLLGDAAGSVS